MAKKQSPKRASEIKKECETKAKEEQLERIKKQKPKGTSKTCRNCIAYDENIGQCHITKEDRSPFQGKCDKNEKTIESELILQIEKENTPKHIVDKANEILDKGDPVQFIFDTHQQLHVGDEAISRTLIVSIGCQSASNTGGIHPKLDGASGKGKSHSEKTMAHMIPKEYKIVGSFSDKSLFYNSDLKAGTVIYSDDIDISNDLTTTIKRATTNYQEYTEHHTLDKDRKLLVNTLPPRLSWWLNSVDNNQSLQLLNRQFGGSVDESFIQDDDVYGFQVESAMMGIVELPETDDIQVCRYIIGDIKSKLFNVIIPFAYLIEWNDKQNRRNFPMFLDMIRAFAVFRYRQRQIHKGFLFAAMQDYEDAEALYSIKAENQRLKLTDSEIEICKFIASKGETDTKALMGATNLTQGRISQLIKGKKDSDSGLINKVRGFRVESRSISKRTREEEEFVDFNSAKKEKIKITHVGPGSIHKDYFILPFFDESSCRSKVVDIPDIDRNEYNQYYLDINSLLISKIDNIRIDINDIYHIYNIHSNNANKEKLKNLLLHSKLKTANIANSNSTDSENRNLYQCNSIGNINGNYGKLINYLKENYDKMRTPTDQEELERLISSMNRGILAMFDIDGHKVVQEYIEERGWK